MRKRSTVIGIGILGTIAAGLVYLAVSMQRASSREMCQVCRRPLHERSRTVGFLGDTQDVFCCPACALTSHQQTGQAVKITELTDFVTDSKLDPANAFLVRGSNVNLCTRHHPLVDDAKQSYAMEYDRCSPSVLAFATREEAESFARDHGGDVMPFREFAGALSR